MKSSEIQKTLSSLSSSFRWLSGTIVALALLFVVFIFQMTLSEVMPNQTVTSTENKPTLVIPDSNFTHLWQAPADWRLMQVDPETKKKIQYGEQLIAHTAEYLGPNGSVRTISNGMNCQNCHLDAGKKAWGNNYGAVEATYPKFRARSGKIENQIKRVNDCFERSLNGKALDSNSREMQSVLAYIKWLGSDVPKKKIPRGAGIFKIPMLSRASDPAKGKLVYEAKCQTCHQANGAGVLAENAKAYTYPPLWGKHSYNTGAGLYRISNLAGYVKYNMPLGVNYDSPQLSNEEAWDVAAFINSMPRPEKDLSNDWPDIASKPFDHPFGPYSDPFSEEQHKFGPYKAIKDWHKSHDKKKNQLSKTPIASL
ncbi:c-type cytochrome [Arcicella sp. DC2W]|uniref:C-type cytochrome n=1 Tax=Arcicella gelida TaxID=2984195 RepID=A0ABU5S842_9BACT|nr:c-type cytochrome [Arcicella sp. DC2W]MEA5404650.1 c-type cytochrome [Arcicella sp. DC2W]